MTPRVTVLIVDDEPLARNGLMALCRADPEFEVVGSAASVAEAVAAIQQLAPQVVMLDVQMPDGTGFDVIEQIGIEQMPFVVFVTAHNEFALDAFDVNAVDYLLKPFDDERFARTAQRARRAVQQQDAGELTERLARLLGSTPPTSYAERLVVKSNGRMTLLQTGEIDWIEAADYYVRIHTGQETHLLRETMASLEQRLDPAKFFRVHRGAIVNLDQVRELQPYFHGDHLVVLRNGVKLKVSRTRREQLERRFT